MNNGTRTILHVYSSWTAGGAEKLMLTLAAELEKRGTHNIIACPQDSYMFSRAAELGLEARHLVIRGSFAPAGNARLWNIIARDKVDIVHAHQGKVFWPCIFMKWLSGSRVRVVFHRHAQLPHKFYSRSHYRFADATIAISDAVARSLIKGENVPAGKVTTVYNGTDLSRFHPRISGEVVRARYGLEGKLVIGTVAAMNRPRGKGQEYLIRAVAELRGQFPQLRCLIVGTGEILDELKEIARQKGVEREVIFTGYCEDVENYIAAMDIFCFLSWDTEGLGQVMVEAQGMGKTVNGTSALYAMREARCYEKERSPAHHPNADDRVFRDVRGTGDISGLCGGHVRRTLVCDAV
jgi:glycosyltransferase involved in cell wall biosynthesis